MTKALLVGGPAHGQLWEVPEGRRQVLAYEFQPLSAADFIEPKPETIRTATYMPARLAFRSGGESGELILWTVDGKDAAVSEVFDAILNDKARAVVKVSSDLHPHFPGGSYERYVPPGPATTPGPICVHSERMDVPRGTDR